MIETKTILAVLITAFSLIAGLVGCRAPSGPPQAAAEDGGQPASDVQATVESTPAAENTPANNTVPTPELKSLAPRTSFATSGKSETDSPIGRVDFRNFEYPLPRGWQDADGKEVSLEDGRRPLSEAEKKIGIEHVATRYFDTTGDGQDEAVVVLQIDTGGSSIPQIVYVFAMKSDGPELIWHFRTGDRADGGLKNIFAENGEVVLELFGQDRYVVGEVETLKIVGDDEDLCCPTHFTRTRYKWNGSDFRMQGKRLTFAVNEPAAAPVENLGEKMEKEKLEKEKRGKK